MDYEHGLLSYCPLVQLMPRIRIAPVLQSAAATGSCRCPLAGGCCQGFPDTGADGAWQEGRLCRARCLPVGTRRSPEQCFCKRRISRCRPWSNSICSFFRKAMCRCTLWIWCSRDTVSIATELALHACGERRRPAVRQQRHRGTPGAEPVPEPQHEAEPLGTAGACSPPSLPGDVAAGKAAPCRGRDPTGGPAGAAPESPHCPIPAASSRCGLGLESSDTA